MSSKDYQGIVWLGGHDLISFKYSFIIRFFEFLNDLNYMLEYIRFELLGLSKNEKKCISHFSSYSPLCPFNLSHSYSRKKF